SLGVCRETLYHTLLNSPAAAPFLATKKSKLQNGNYEPDFPLQWMHKDLQLIAETAYENDIALPAGNMVKEIYALAKKSGLGEQDFSSVFR
ncbi:MAG TPA: NAD(P)-dependent oxidoreductase, partial [Nitrospiraceae bacterium]|nr:NAD(P)-dependent oxidoreductase [Nitrospiraceae bacterium]